MYHTVHRGCTDWYTRGVVTMDGSQTAPDAGRETREDRRAQLIEAAADHVAAHGIADLSLRLGSAPRSGPATAC
ncbi:TetR/AcrR family transcriptional regulator OS=Streptomyces tendae OX=1932 GN=GUR47_23785 PE=4 SV=1 [Streptomyces tendae]